MNGIAYLCKPDDFVENKIVSKALYAELHENSVTGKSPVLQANSHMLHCSRSSFLVENKTQLFRTEICWVIQ